MTVIAACVRVGPTMTVGLRVAGAASVREERAGSLLSSIVSKMFNSSKTSAHWEVDAVSRRGRSCAFRPCPLNRSTIGGPCPSYGQWPVAQEVCAFWDEMKIAQWQVAKRSKMHVVCSKSEADPRYGKTQRGYDER